MSSWVEIEKLLMEYLGRFNNRKVISSVSLIKMIEDKELRARLNKARMQRNILAHNVDKDFNVNELLSEDDLKKIYNDLEEYYRMFNHHK